MKEYKEVIKEIRKIAGWRENNILDHLVKVEKVKAPADYEVLRFVSTDGTHFDYDTKSKQITG